NDFGVLGEVPAPRDGRRRRAIGILAIALELLVAILQGKLTDSAVIDCQGLSGRRAETVVDHKMTGISVDLVAENIDLLEGRAGREHLEQFWVEPELREAQS